MKPDPPEVSKEFAHAEIAITMDQIQDFQFRVKFDKDQYPDLKMDEPPPLGADTGPNASRLLAAAVGNCLSASFLFSARKVRANIESLHTTVKIWYARNERGRLRIGKLKVEIEPKFDAADAAKIGRCVGLFEDFCVVTQSVRGGIDVSVEVKS
ncbi:MAG: OsmC family protein [Acidobacteriota bacterium]|jgi:organic hydroperoxide reductase OsmC/OhrA